MEPVKKEKNTEGSSVFGAKAFESALMAQVKAAGEPRSSSKAGISSRTWLNQRFNRC